jgi:hypothetical protein
MSSTTGLIAKLDAWLLQQPEYVALLAGSRRDRRRAAQLLAQHVFTIPARQAEVPLNRKGKRALIRVYTGKLGEEKASVSRRQRLQNNAAVKQRARYSRLSAKRLAELAARAEDKRIREEAGLEDIPDYVKLRKMTATEAAAMDEAMLNND